ncbi:S24 family peptidase [Bradyrhizobium septentrionale]|uniref:LexA family transcriptional regulator n=1 Tax=Bradyrhizobium septentrionale TaxID=1404411 RepID=A0A973W0L3_9BRAD|nr:S24 family peptidase [Bradyrhizobium septentrionale]UGY14171.1 S24 family peptidase [Bradyrhizobium septentrionale]
MKGTELRQRVSDRLGQLQLGPVEAARRVPGLERNYISDFLSGKKRSFSQAKIHLVAEALDLTVEELTGPGRRIISDRPGSKVNLVPLIDIVTAGRLTAPSSQIPLDDVPLLAFADLGRGNFFALRVVGDSMDRVSPDGSIIVVNKDDRQLVSGKYYVFSIRGETTYKMWQADDPPYLAPYSTNPLNKPRMIKRKNDFEVIGRVKRTVLDL